VYSGSPKPALANINGTAVPLDEAKIPALDRGFLFGDAVYEVIRVYQGRPWLMQEHFSRLAHSLAEIRITGVNLPCLQQRVLETIQAGGFGESLIYVQITRGTAPRRHAFPAQTQPLEFFYVQEFRDTYGEWRENGAGAITDPDLRWQRCDIKSTNLLGNVLAMQAATEAGCIEALLYKPDGTLTEGTHTSLFAVRDGVLLAPPQNPTILPGITRQLIESLAADQNVILREQSISLRDLDLVEELFLTGTTSEVLPLIHVDKAPIGTARPGPVTRRLQAAYNQAVQTFLTK
jgi:D-alanine transaminase